MAGLLPQHRLALDMGCGTGQLTVKLASHFDAVIGVDPSVEQIANAVQHPRTIWRCARAEDIPLAGHSADLITAAQSAHWFDLPAFYAETRRIAAPGAVIALVSYGVLHLEGKALDAHFARFYCDEIGRFWPPERKLVDSGYADRIPF